MITMAHDGSRWYILMNGCQVGNRAGYVHELRATGIALSLLNGLYAYDPAVWAGKWFAR